MLCSRHALRVSDRAQALTGPNHPAKPGRSRTDQLTVLCCLIPVLSYSLEQLPLAPHPALTSVIKPRNVRHRRPMSPESKTRSSSLGRIHSSRSARQGFRWRCLILGEGPACLVLAGRVSLSSFTIASTSSRRRIRPMQANDSDTRILALPQKR
ncbi:hypothetical protein IW261DRAFT_258359 [Armillaria novae-zelandiae]|uniref:Uncharacterized protein n=1 Tax=Armillaria novae-zelandiae TaxID=153914 RepID=A0AA39UGJ4_9AGAR|nr:hypothetical protein IW261DRAFT_258359 [Armillaria novae-zelandiae]